MVHNTNIHPNDELKKPNIWIKRFLIAKLKKCVKGASEKQSEHALGCLAVHVRSEGGEDDCVSVLLVLIGALEDG